MFLGAEVEGVLCVFFPKRGEDHLTEGEVGGVHVMFGEEGDAQGAGFGVDLGEWCKGGAFVEVFECANQDIKGCCDGGKLCAEGGESILFWGL